VAIRTITIDGSALTMGTGSGVVWDSVAEDEYEECLIKTRFLLDTAT
jgi:para-aminobenzoate synthetase/4-amino-4-deoxychorismate lyase